MTNADLLGLYPTYSGPKSTPMSRATLNALYRDQCPLSIAHLSKADLESYAAVLSHHPPLELPANDVRNRAYRQQTAGLIAGLPKELLRSAPLPQLPEAYLTSIFHKVGMTDSLPPAAKLCKLHSPLNAQVVADAFGAVEMEIDDFLPRLLKRVGVLNLSDEVLALAQSLENVMATRLVQQQFCSYYRRAPPAEWCNGSGGCDACVLARVGSSEEVLVALRTFMLARMPIAVLRGEQRSPRLDLVEAWMKCFGREESLKLLARSSCLADELVQLRNEVKQRKVEFEQRAKHNGWPMRSTSRATPISRQRSSSIYSYRSAALPEEGYSPAPHHNSGATVAAERELSFIEAYCVFPTKPLPPLPSEGEAKPSLRSFPSCLSLLPSPAKEFIHRRVESSSSKYSSRASSKASARSTVSAATPMTPASFSGLPLWQLEQPEILHDAMWDASETFLPDVAAPSRASVSPPSVNYARKPALDGAVHVPSRLFQSEESYTLPDQEEEHRWRMSPPGAVGITSWI